MGFHLLTRHLEIDGLVAGHSYMVVAVEGKLPKVLELTQLQEEFGCLQDRNDLALSFRFGGRGGDALEEGRPHCSLHTQVILGKRVGRELKEEEHALMVREKGEEKEKKERTKAR